MEYLVPLGGRPFQSSGASTSSLFRFGFRLNGWLSNPLARLADASAQAFGPPLMRNGTTRLFLNRRPSPRQNSPLTSRRPFNGTFDSALNCYPVRTAARCPWTYMPRIPFRNRWTYMADHAWFARTTLRRLSAGKCHRIYNHRLG